ncbi:4-(cytidine 5'-diphospho)-2-C-methyl-D-erythritol kinase [Corynebacterium halotolerans]|uniref:4-(cytidine 5'-diphospho)-2-C-methyl-D-erythritol kinase n=1 Tax=Corynebacterium halotolerans TaxID=225326 RepID=UPI003CF9AB35
MGVDVIRARAHAKINLHLGVGAARADGYHELVTVFQSLSLHDELELHVRHGTSAGAGSVVNSLDLGGTAGGVPADSSNLAWRAVDKLVAVYRGAGVGDLPMVDLKLRKGIPVAGGMAGGSADAAAALRAAHAWLAELADPVPEADLERIAAELGSDVPFTLHGGTMLGTGRGENLVPVLSRGQYHWVLGVSSQGLSTPEVFAKLDELRASGRDLPAATDTAALNRALLSGDPTELAGCLVNDLQAPATSLRPGLRKILTAGSAAGALQGIVSGSGPTCAFLCRDADHAGEVAAELTDTGLVLTARTATGPAEGAHVVPETF